MQAWADSYWSESDRNVYAAWPRLSMTPTGNNTQTSTYWMRNGQLLRLKQAEIGYKLDKNFVRKFRFQSFRIYVSGTNLLRFSKFKLWDPEMGSNGLGYPLQRVFNIGINAGL